MVRILAAGLLVCIAVQAQAQTKTYENTFTPEARQVYSEDINVWAYTSAFAKRFGMPKQWIDDNLKGAYAVAFRVETSSARTMFPHKGPDVSKLERDCILDVYISSTAKIPWSDDRIAGKKWYTPDSPTYLMPQSREDWLWRRRDVGVAHSGKKARQPLIRLDGGTLFLREYDKSLYPGLSYLSLSMGCMTPPKRASIVEFCEDKYWVGRQCDAQHVIELPSSFMQKLFAEWHQRSRVPAETDWRRVIQGQ